MEAISSSLALSTSTFKLMKSWKKILCNEIPCFFFHASKLRWTLTELCGYFQVRARDLEVQQLKQWLWCCVVSSYGDYRWRVRKLFVVCCLWAIMDACKSCFVQHTTLLLEDLHHWFFLFVGPWCRWQQVMSSCSCGKRHSCSCLCHHIVPIRFNWQLHFANMFYCSIAIQWKWQGL